MKLKTLHGEFEFAMQTYQLDGSCLTFLELTQSEPASYVSRGLPEFSVCYSNRLSYREVAGLIEQQCGRRLLSEQTIWQLVQQRGLQVSDAIEWSVVQQRSVSKPIEVATAMDLYDAEREEVVLFDDGISVKAQKPQRHPPSPAEVNAKELSHPKTVLTDVVMLQTAPGKFEYLSAPMTADGSVRLPLETVVQAKVQQVYGAQTAPLPFIVISDGAKVIRQRWTQTFGTDVTVILDGYHLSKKVRDLMSMIARTKAEKTEHLKRLLVELWRGQTQAALN